uniref:HTH CENPB-type domain-containing protein n=1 Tax=Ditylenchus dipsaci TaxID=166011 RepID=A0A915CYY0_9BILA
MRVSRRMIMDQARRLFNVDDEEGNFKGSRGWLENFLQRHNFRLRVPTTVCQKPPQDYAQKIADFVVYVSCLRKKTGFDSLFCI